jgi:hypothetical protein
VLFEIHDLSILQPLDTPISKKDTLTGLEHCLEQADMMPRRMEMQMKPYTIDGHEGILATIDRGKENPLYIVAYSPDLEAGSGTVVCIVGSSFPWETTQSIIDSIEAQVV